MKFKELLQEQGIDFRDSGHEHCRPGWIQLDCPYCSADWKHYRLGYNISAGYLNCWTCGRHGLVETLATILGISYGQVKKLLGDVDTELAPAKVERGKLVLPTGLGPLLKPHKDYLRRRGYKPDELQRLWEIRGIDALGGVLSWRVFIPVHYRGRIVSWTTRSIDDQHSHRYRAARPEQESIDHRTLLYGLDYCRHSIVVCEGPTDVWRIGPGAVCTFGTGFSRAQVCAMAEFPIRVVCFDSAPDAQKRARELCDLLEVYPGETYNVVLESKDPGSGTDEEIREIRLRFLGAAA
jgi:hypothetical protein